MFTIFIVVIFVLTGSFLCSGSEAAIFSISELKIKSLVEEGRSGAKNLLFAKQNMQQTIGTIVISNNLFNIVGSIVIGNLTSQIFDDLWLGVFSALLTLAIILFGEIIPKNLGQKNAIAFSLLAAGPVLFFSKLFSPLLWFINRINSIFKSDSSYNIISEAEIKMLLDLSSKQNQIENDEHEIIQNVFNLNDKKAKDIMTPRVNIIGLDADLSLEEQKDIIYNFSPSRLPVYRDDYDTILGFVLLREVLQAYAEGKGSIKPTDILHQIKIVREDIRVDSLLFIFKKTRSHIALVVDQFKGTGGIVTLEDVLEELVGEIMDETDTVLDMREIQTTPVYN